MTDLTGILSAIELGDRKAAEQLLPLVYDELRRLAAQKLAQEKPGCTLQATALVHEAYLRLVVSPAHDSKAASPEFDGRRHFFAAASEAMRRILVEAARRKARLRHGGGRQQVELEEAHLAIELPNDDLLAIDEALEQLAAVDAQAAEMVKLRYFAGMTTEQAAEVLGLTERTAYRTWSFARAWLFRRLNKDEGSSTA